MQKSPAGSRTLTLPLLPIQARRSNQQPAGGGRKNSCESTKARRLSNERLSSTSTATTTRTRTKTVGSKNVIRWHCAWRGTRGSIGAYTMAHCLSSGWHTGALRTRGFCQIMPMLALVPLALSLLLSPFLCART